MTKNERRRLILFNVQHTFPIYNNFMAMYCCGIYTEDQIDDQIDEWHNAYKDKDIYPQLHEYLGMFRDEYGQWVKDADCLPRLKLERNNAINI